jgi:ribosomal-protein-alanine acetyltransferase
MGPNTNDVKIRPFHPSDIDAATQILLQSPGAVPWSRTAYEKLLGQAGALAFVCELGRAIVGFIIARQAADEAEILNLAVTPQSRRTGHGSALLLAALQEFQQQNVTRVFLEVRDSNATAIAFYRKHGFVPTSRRKAYYSGPKEDALLMRKKLTIDRKY